MLYWLITIILAYFFFSLAFLGDKLVLAGSSLSAGGQAKPVSYTFYVGFLNILTIFIIPFVGFSIPSASQFFWIILDAIIYIAGLYAMFVALEKFEVSTVMTTIGAIQPVFILFLTWSIWGFKAMSGLEMLAFLLLLAGTFIISFKKSASATGDYLKIAVLAAALFSLDYILQKVVFVDMSFWQGFVWIRIFSFLFSLVFLLRRSWRKEIFQKKTIGNKKTQAIFFCTQTSGGLANFLQSLAIFLVPTGFLPIINSLRGIQYVFLFLMTLFLTFFFPKILKEEISKKALAQKAVSIILIVAGLALLI